MNDLISRLSEIRSNYNCFDEKEEPYYRALSEAIQLVSVQSEQKKGEWGYRWKIHGDGRRPTELFPCSECGYENTSATNYCPNCGADMRYREESL